MAEEELDEDALEGEALRKNSFFVEIIGLVIAASMLFGLNYICVEIFQMGSGMAKLVATTTSFGLLFLSPVNRALMELARGIWGLLIIGIAIAPFIVMGFIFVSLPEFPAWFVSLLILGAIMVLVIVRQLMR